MLKNKRTDRHEAGDIYIGRPSKWGNPFIVGKDGSRDEVCQKYAVWLARNEDLMRQVTELRGRNLVCWCSPQRCHGTILEFLANCSSDARVGWKLLIIAQNPL